MEGKSKDDNIKTVGKDKNETVSCKICSKKYNSFNCCICNRSFKSKYYLEKHVVYHSGIKPFECEKCEKKYKRADHLKRHMKVHFEQHPFHCIHCAKFFDEQTSWQHHLILCKDKKPFECEKCEKKYKRGEHLRRHMKVHKEQHPYHCKHCAKGFDDQSIWQHHLILCKYNKLDKHFTIENNSIEDESFYNELKLTVTSDQYYQRSNTFPEQLDHSTTNIFQSDIKTKPTKVSLEYTTLINCPVFLQELDFSTFETISTFASITSNLINCNHFFLHFNDSDKQLSIYKCESNEINLSM